jgi:hypothetical protein
MPKIFEGFEKNLGRLSQAGVAECDFSIRIRVIVTVSQHRKVAAGTS